MSHADEESITIPRRMEELKQGESLLVKRVLLKSAKEGHEPAQMQFFFEPYANPEANVAKSL